MAHYFVLANPGVVSGAVLIDANVPQFFTDTQTQRLVALTTPQIEELKKAPSTKANRQLIATADNFGPTHQAYHKLSWPDSVPVTFIVSDKTPFDGSPQDAQTLAGRGRWASWQGGPRPQHSSPPREARTTSPRTSPPWCSRKSNDGRHRQVKATETTADRTGETG